MDPLARSRMGTLLSLFSFPDLRDGSTGAGLNATFSLVLRVVLLFGVVLAIWAAGAAVLRTEWLLSPCGPLACHTATGAGAAATPGPCPCTGEPPTLGWFAHGVLLAAQIARGIGGVGAICLAGGLLGAILGFLFGLPQAAGTDAASTGKTWQTSTNLTQISDWLTKIIVGVSLVTAGATWSQFVAIVNTSANWLFEMRHGSPTVIGAALLGGFVLGFMFTYLYTDLVIARLIAATDKSLNELLDTVRQVIASIGADAEVLGPRISRIPQEGTLPTIEQATAAMQLLDVELKDLSTRRDIKMWARARAVLNSFEASADGYAKVLAMPADTQVPTDAGLLIESARVFYAAQRKAEAVIWAELALGELDAKPDLLKQTDLKQAIVGDAVVLRLAGYVQGGSQAALRLIGRYLEDRTKAAPNDLPDDAIGRLHLLRALANAQRYARDKSLTDPEKAAVRANVMADLQFVVSLGKYGKDTLREFWRPADPRLADPHDRHDDLAVFGPDDTDLRAMLGTQPS